MPTFTHTRIRTRRRFTPPTRKNPSLPLNRKFLLRRKKPTSIHQLSNQQPKSPPSFQTHLNKCLHPWLLLLKTRLKTGLRLKLRFRLRLKLRLKLKLKLRLRSKPLHPKLPLLNLPLLPLSLLLLPPRLFLKLNRRRMSVLNPAVLPTAAKLASHAPGRSPFTTLVSVPAVRPTMG